MRKRYQVEHLPRRPLEEARLKIARLAPKKLGLTETFQQICRIAAEAIAVERVGIWLFVEGHSAIRCACVYERSQGRYTEGAVLRLADFPSYFEHLQIRKTIPAENAVIDPRTDELVKAYLEPLGIISLLDAVILHHDQSIGVVCHEHTGPAREWTTEERDFAGSVADLIAFKIQGAKLAEVQQQLNQTAADLASHQQRVKLAHMAAGVAHDFRNLLTVIKGYASIITDDPGATAPLQNMSRQIQQTARKGEALTADLMALSGNQTGHPAVIDLAANLRALLPHLRQCAGARHPVEVHLPERIGRVFIDPLQLERIVLNLVANARDAMPAGGPVTVTLSAGAVDAPGQPGSWAVLEIMDRGSGIPPALQERIFEPFFTTKSRDQGTGLGLAIVKTGVEMAGGQVQLVSELGQGSTFRILLPCVASGS
jgi:two-component system cell cycle sensor histidine kinase/response regulator CckA